jgi:hypothetical protein
MRAACATGTTCISGAPACLSQRSRSSARCLGAGSRCSAWAFARCTTRDGDGISSGVFHLRGKRSAPGATDAPLTRGRRSRPHAMNSVQQSNGNDKKQTARQLQAEQVEIKAQIANIQQKCTWLVQQSEKHERLLGDILVRQDRIETHLTTIIRQNDEIMARRDT